MTRTEDLERLRQLVERMRDAQKQYFRTRSIDALGRAERLERQVDRRLAELAEGQTRLFGEGP